MYSTALLQTVASHVDAEFITARWPIGHKTVNEKIEFVFPPIPQCFRDGQAGVIQGHKGLATVDLAKFEYIGNDNWIPKQTSSLSVMCMHFKLMGLD